MNAKTGFILMASIAALGCVDANHPLAPTVTAAVSPASASFSVAPARLTSLSAGIDDALGRVLPSLGSGDNVGALRTSLEAISAAVAAGDAPATADAIVAARTNIGAVAAEKGDDATADLSAITLAIDVVAGSMTSSAN